MEHCWIRLSTFQDVAHTMFRGICLQSTVALGSALRVKPVNDYPFGKGKKPYIVGLHATPKEDDDRENSVWHGTAVHLNTCGLLHYLFSYTIFGRNSLNRLCRSVYPCSRANRDARA